MFHQGWWNGGTIQLPWICELLDEEGKYKLAVNMSFVSQWRVDTGGRGLIPYPMKSFDPQLKDTSCRVNTGQGFCLQMNTAEQAVQTEL